MMMARMQRNKPPMMADAEAPMGSAAERASCRARSRAVSAQANIFGAGTDDAPAPGGGGGGVSPPSWRFPARASVVRFPSVTGKVTALAGQYDYHGPAGDRGGATDIKSYRGISGIVDRRSGLFLVGVFLTDNPASKPAPRRLDFTTRERLRMLAPRIGQTFFVGDAKGRSFSVPRAATRLFLGFADAFSYDRGAYRGDPGYYDNNAGHLCVAVDVAMR
jgi:hypothetical protein